MDATSKAYCLAKEAAELDFSAAISGLLAGHEIQLQKLKSEIGRKDMALLASLALSKKGTKIGADGGLEKTVCEGLEKSISSEIEKEFLSRSATT